MYLVSILIGMCLVYWLLLFLFPLFFSSTTPSRAVSLSSMIYIILSGGLAFALSFSVAGAELSNRIMHVFGGGFLGFFTCFLAAKDSRIRTGKLQFFIFSFLIVTALGVANEIIEFVLQTYWHLDFAESVDDTWLDLISNCGGILIASICTVPFVKIPVRPARMSRRTPLKKN
jgi:hypothetical protein